MNHYRRPQQSQSSSGANSGDNDGDGDGGDGGSSHAGGSMGGQGQSQGPSRLSPFTVRRLCMVTMSLKMNTMILRPKKHINENKQRIG